MPISRVLGCRAPRRNEIQRIQEFALVAEVALRRALVCRR
nr:MAG TPA: hypothetical protein [Bacteriophage sp.]